ncbi:MAG: type II secretion system protein [bacterium]
MNIFKFKHKKTKGMSGSAFRTRKTTAGFTLIELLVVISIIGFLSSVVLASTKTAREKAQDSKIAQDLRQFGIAVQLYYDDHQSYNIITLGGEDKSLAVNEEKDNFSIKDLNIFSTKIAEAYADGKCNNFVAIGNILVQHKYLSSVPKHPKDDGANICYKTAYTASNFTAYGQLSRKTSWDSAKYKQAGIVLGDITVAKLQEIYNATESEYPTAVAGGQINDLALVSDIILGSVNSNTASSSSAIYLNVVTTGGGSVSKSPNKTTYINGDHVTLTSEQSAPDIVAKWTGCDYVSDIYCYVTIGTSNKTINVDFLQGYHITIQEDPLGPSPNYKFLPTGNYYTQTNGPGAYSQYYYPGQKISVYMTDPASYGFSDFGGCEQIGGVLGYGYCSFRMPSENVFLVAFFNPY